jgi:hypothetical protein
MGNTTGAKQNLVHPTQSLNNMNFIDTYYSDQDPFFHGTNFKARLASQSNSNLNAHESTSYANYGRAQQQQRNDPTAILSYLYLGGNAVNKNPQMAQYLGLTHVLNMAMELTPNEDLQRVVQNMKYLHITADDSLTYNIRVHFEDAFKIIDDAKYSNGKILVHCMMGISRSGKNFK